MDRSSGHVLDDEELEADLGRVLRSTAGGLTHEDVVAAGRAAFCWRAVSQELAELLGPDGVARVP